MLNAQQVIIIRNKIPKEKSRKSFLLNLKSLQKSFTKIIKTPKPNMTKDCLVRAANNSNNKELKCHFFCKK